MSSADARRLGVGAAVAAVLLGLFVPLGRWERSHWASEENAGMRRTMRVVGLLDSRLLSGYRVTPDFDCLTYRRGADPLALELCFDSSGRLVETIDRRTSTRRISSLRADPSRAAVYVSPARVRRLLRRMEAG